MASGAALRSCYELCGGEAALGQRSYALPAPVCWFVILECVNTLAPGSAARIRIGLPHQRLDRIKMILTQCAVCATELGLTLGKKCGRCSTRYCGPECQVQHWKEGGHDKLCRKIKKAGGAEQYNANKKYAEARHGRWRRRRARRTRRARRAISARRRSIGRRRRASCACVRAVERRALSHVSCLAEQAKILVAEAEENSCKVFDERFQRWYECSLCEQRHHGVVSCALGWACWKTYVGRPETDVAQAAAMGLLGNGLSQTNQNEDALSVREALLATQLRLGAPEKTCSSRRAILRARIESLDWSRRPQTCFEMYTLGV